VALLREHYMRMRAHGPHLGDLVGVDSTNEDPLGPRYQKTLQLVLLYSGHLRLWVDGTMREAASKSVCILLPEREEYFAFDTRSEHHHSWVHLALPTFSPQLLARLQQLVWPLPLAPVMTQFMREALMLQTLPFPTSQEMLKALALHWSR
jgi:hypothetical protein